MLAQEDLIQRSSIPYTIVRATQFFEFINGIADEATDGNTVRLPPTLIQPMAADDAASALARVAVGPPLNGTVEIAGPDQFRLDELLRRLVKERDDPRKLITDPHARCFGIAPSERALLPGDNARIAHTHLYDWLRNARPPAPTPTQSGSAATHEIRVSVVSRDAADHGVAELWAAGSLIDLD